eukprot:TRINITY_DN7607_c0_g1_i1.p1 TRINITY_DN7607_c0_g1~~TRINITY_DN7607_c0_g1_i1.p1  ORF type:complete len:531 (+),score=80.20 TRINITY_DN7607_c0_g1_i1:47-1639(+)
MAPRSARGSCVAFSEAAPSHATEYSRSFDSRSSACSSPGRSRAHREPRNACSRRDDVSEYSASRTHETPRGARFRDDISEYSARTSNAHSMMRRSKSAAPERDGRRLATYGPEPPPSFAGTSFAEQSRASAVSAGCPTKKCCHTEGWSTRFHREEGGRSRARSEDAFRFQRESLIAHREEPLPVYRTKNTPGAGPLGRKSEKKGRGGWLTGAEDMHPAAQKKCLATDLPPSEELKAINAVKAHDFTPAAARKSFKADLEPSDELRNFNAKKAHYIEAKPTRQYASKADLPASQESQRRNDHRLLQGPDRACPPRALHPQHFESEGLRHCLESSNYPQRRMSDCSRESGIMDLSSRATDDDGRSMCTSAWSSQAGVSDVSSCYGGGRYSEAASSQQSGWSAATGSRASGSRCSDMRSARSEYSMSSYSSRYTSERGSDCGSSYVSRRSSEAASSYAHSDNTARDNQRRVPQPPELRKAAPARSDASSAVGSFASRSSKSGSYTSRGSEASSLCSQGSFSLGGYSYGQRGRT